MGRRLQCLLTVLHQAHLFSTAATRGFSRHSQPEQTNHISFPEQMQDHFTSTIPIKSRCAQSCWSVNFWSRGVASTELVSRWLRRWCWCHLLGWRCWPYERLSLSSPSEHRRSIDVVGCGCFFVEEAAHRGQLAPSHASWQLRSLHSHALFVTFFDFFPFVLGCSRRSLTICTFLFQHRCKKLLYFKWLKLVMSSNGLLPEAELRPSAFLGWETWNRCNSDHRGRTGTSIRRTCCSRTPCTFKPTYFQGTGTERDADDLITLTSPRNFHLWRRWELTTDICKLHHTFCPDQYWLRVTWNSVTFFLTHWALFVWFLSCPRHTTFSPLPNCFSCIIFCPLNVLFGSLSAKVGPFGLPRCFGPPWMDNSRKGPQLFLDVDESFRSSWTFEFKMCSQRSLATLLQDGLSHVRRSNRLFWNALKNVASFSRYVPRILPSARQQLITLHDQITLHFNSRK